MIPVIIPVFNRPEHTSLCLDSIYKKDPGIEIQPIIVNNSSRKTTSTLIDNWISKFDANIKNIGKPLVIRTDRNRGFSGAVNAGIKDCDENAICILHNDTVVTDLWLSEMFQVLDGDTAVVCPSTNYANENGFCVKDIRMKFEALKPPNKEAVSVAHLEDVIKQTYSEYGGLDSYAQSLKSFSPASTFCNDVSSFCMLVQGGLFQKFGGFDEDFWPRMFEDKLWFQNVAFEGYSCQMSNRSFVHHFGNATSDGPGFSFPQIAEINEVKFKQKLEKIIAERGLKS